jgi:hypothetical protein
MHNYRLDKAGRWMQSESRATCPIFSLEIYVTMGICVVPIVNLYIDCLIVSMQESLPLIQVNSYDWIGAGGRTMDVYLLCI